MTELEKPSRKIVRIAFGAILISMLLICAPAAAGSVTGGGQATTSELILSLYEISVTADTGISFTINGQQVSSAVVFKGDGAEIKVTSIPAGYSLKPEYSGTVVHKQTGNTITLKNVGSDVVVTLKAEPYIPPSPSGGGKQQGSSVWLQPVPQGPVTTDITLQYSGVQFIAVSVADIASVRTIDSQYAATLEEKLLTAEKAGIRLTNNRGARAIVQSNADLPDISKVTFSRVYDIKPANPNEKVTQVTVTVPKVDIVASGLTTDDVTIYHYLAEYDIWVPLDTLQITGDFINYYYTAATNGASPFGVLIKRFEAETDVPSVPVEPAASPAPLMSVLAGLGAAAVLFGLRKK